MPNEPSDPITFSVQECADAFGVSTDTILRQVHGGSLQAIQVGRRVMVLRQSVADVIARALDPKDERRKAVDHFDGLLAADAAADRRAAAENATDRAKRLSPAGQRATAKRLQKERDDANPDYGTRGSRIKVVKFHGKGADPISDSQVDASDIIGADPNKGKGEGARAAFVLDPSKVKETSATARPRWSDAIAEQTALDAAELDGFRRG
jgi:excisionase family DNA binding protein